MSYAIKNNKNAVIPWLLEKDTVDSLEVDEDRDPFLLAWRKGKIDIAKKILSKIFTKYSMSEIIFWMEKNDLLDLKAPSILQLSAELGAPT